MKSVLTILLVFSLFPIMGNAHMENEELNKKIENVVIPKLNLSDMTVPQAVLHMQELYKAESGEDISIFLSPRAALKEKKINLSTKNLSFLRNLQFFCSGRTANLVFDVKGDTIYISEPFEKINSNQAVVTIPLRLRLHSM